MSELEKLKAQINVISEGLADIVNRLNELEHGWQQSGQPSDRLERAQKMFPDELAKKLDFKPGEGDYINIFPKTYLGKTTFGQIAQIVRDVGGEYISAGKESHFRVEIK